MFDTVAELGEIKDMVYDVLINDEITPEDWMKAVEDLADVTGDVTGLPLKTAKRITHEGLYENIIRDQDYAAGIMTMMGWSPYYTQNLKKKSPVDQALMDEQEKYDTKKDEVKASAKTSFDEIQRLSNEGNKVQANKIIKDMSDDEYDEYKKLKKKEVVANYTDDEKELANIKKKTIAVRPAGYEQLIRRLESEGNKDQANKIIKEMTDAEYDAWKAYTK